MRSFNRVKPNTFTPRPAASYDTYRQDVAAKYDALATTTWPLLCVPFDSVLDKLKITRSHFVGASVLLSRAQIAQKLGVSKQTVYRLFSLEIAPEGVPSRLNNEVKFDSDDVFHFISKVYPRRAPIHKAALLLQLEAALDKGGASNMQALAEWALFGIPCAILSNGGRHV